jgi:hypothetical protein
MTDRTNAERQARFAARVREQGLVKICEWIPADCRDTFKRIAAEMRGDAAPPAPEPAPPPPPPDDIVGKVLEAHGWGWAPNAIAAYVGITAQQVQRILEEK